jgi:hypothetical protein
LELQYLPYKQVDKQKWDRCIRTAANGLIYAESVYLDTMASQWDAIVLGDYEAVMPLTWKKKLGIRYLYQPAFFQQGGIFSRNPVPAALVHAFISLASLKFRFAELTLNHANTAEKNSLFKTTWRNNYILPLHPSYETIHRHFHSDLKQSVKKLADGALVYKKSMQYAETIELSKQLYQQRSASLADKDYLHLKQLCKYYTENRRLVVREVYDENGTELLAAALLLKDRNRLYNIISCLLPKGKKSKANYFLYDQLIREYAGRELILDFEGSDLPGIAFFYRKFTKENQPYPFIKYNLLPAPIRLLKP